MADVVAFLKRDWQAFRADRPGERFWNHSERVKRGPAAVKVIQIAIGIALLAVGVVLVFIPGPAFLAFGFGLACFAGLSSWLARQLDRAEPPLRRRARRVRDWWRRKRGKPPVQGD